MRKKEVRKRAEGTTVGGQHHENEKLNFSVNPLFGKKKKKKKRLQNENNHTNKQKNKLDIHGKIQFSCQSEQCCLHVFGFSLRFKGREWELPVESDATQWILRDGRQVMLFYSDRLSEGSSVFGVCMWM